MPYPDTNIPPNLYYATAKLLSIVRSFLNIQDLQTETQELEKYDKQTSQLNELRVSRTKL